MPINSIQLASQKAKFPYSIILSQGKLYAVYHGAKKNKLIGKGTTGSVRLVQDLDSGDWYALKVQKQYKNPFRRKQQISEAKISKSIGLANSSAETTSATKGERFKILLELIPGKPLDQHLKELSQVDEVPFEKQLRIAINFLANLEHIHKQGIAHRDIKTENIMSDVDTNQVRIFDFGGSCSSDDDALDEGDFEEYIAQDISQAAKVLAEVFQLTVKYSGSELSYDVSFVKNENCSIPNRALKTITETLRNMSNHAINPADYPIDISKVKKQLNDILRTQKMLSARQKGKSNLLFTQNPSKRKSKNKKNYDAKKRHGDNKPKML